VNPEKMTPEELAKVLNIHEETIRKLAKTQQIPCFRHKKRIYFNFSEVLKAFERLEESAV